MTTALQFSVYDMCHCYNNLNSTHTLNMIVYFCPFGLQFELLQQTQMRWPSWFQDLESYQPMGGGLSLVQLTAVIWCSFARTKLTKPLHQTTCSTMRGAFVTLMAMAASCSRKIPAPLGQAYSTGGGFTASATTPCSSGSIIRSSNQSSIISPAMITVLCNFHSRGGAVFTHHTMGFMNHHIQRFVDTACCQIIFSVWKASSFHAMDGFCKPDMRRCGSCQQQICTTWFVLISRLSHVFCCCSTTLFCWILCTVVSLKHSSGLKDRYLSGIKCILTHLRRMYW